MNNDNDQQLGANMQATSSSAVAGPSNPQSLSEPSQVTPVNSEESGKGSKQRKSKKRSAEVLAEMKKTNEQMVSMQEQLLLLHKQIEVSQRRLQVQESTNAQQAIDQGVVTSAQASGVAPVETAPVSNNAQQPGSQATANQQAIGSSSLFASTQLLAATNLYKVYGFKGKTPEEVDAWFRELYSLKDQMKMADTEILRMFSQWITNEDLIRWWRQISPEIKTLADAQKELRTVCGDNTPPHIALMKALRVHQKWDEKVDKYILGQRELLSRVYPRFNDQQLPVILWQGLSHAIKAEMKMKSGMSMPDFLEECRSAEAIARAKRSNNHKRFKSGNDNDDSEKWCENCSKKTHNTSECWSKNGKGQKRVNKSSTSNEPKATEAKKSKLECYICKGPHLASQCLNK